MIKTINPLTEQVLETYNWLRADEVEARLTTAHEAYQIWSEFSFEQRGLFLRAWAHEMRSHREALADLACLEMGKLRREALGEVEKCAQSLDYHADHAEAFFEPRNVSVPDLDVKVAIRPLGLIFGIMPWNFPYWQVVRFVSTTLMAGNTVLIKHAPNTLGCSELLMDLAIRSGMPSGVVADLPIDVSQVPKIIADRRVRGVSLTGSTRAGRAVAELAGHHLKPCVLELGGSDAYIVLEDADLELAVNKCVQGRLLNAGQSCIAAKRFLVARPVYGEFVERMHAAFSKLQMGDSRDGETTLAPLARRDLRDLLANQVQRSVSGGSRLVMGGIVPKRKGFFFEPTILADLSPEQVGFREEFFGPVACVASFENEGQAFEWANESSYGLGGAIFTRDALRAMKMAEAKLDCGMVAINDFVRSDVRWPFGGVKDSGFGRELTQFGALAFCNVKSILKAKQPGGS